MSAYLTLSISNTVMNHFLDFGKDSREVIILLDSFQGFGNSVISICLSFINLFDHFILKAFWYVDMSLVVVEFAVLYHSILVLLDVVVVFIGL